MSNATSKASAYFRKSLWAIEIALLVGLVLGAVWWFAGGRLGRVRPYLFYFQPLVIGYALGRIHQLADQREHHSDPREPKGGGLPLALVHRTYSVDVHDPARDVGKQLRRVQPPERLLRDEQRLPDHRGGVLHLLEALGRGRPQPHRGEGRLHRVRGPEMLPVLARELIERHHPLPVAIEDAPDFSMTALRAPRLKRALLPLGLLPRLGVRDLREQTPRFRLPFEWQLVEHVQEAMIPAPLLLRLRKHRGQRTPDPEVTIADHHLRRRQPAPGEVPQDRRPALRRFPIAALDGEDHLLAVAQRGQHDEDRGLVLLEAGLHVHAVHPEVDDVEVLDHPGLPEFVLRLPARLEARDRGRRQRRAVAEQPAQGEIEVALGQPVQVQLRQQPADFLRAPFERRQQPALEAFTQPAHSRAPQGDRAVAQAQPPWLAEAVAVARNGIDTVAPFVPRTPEHAVHLFFPHPLQELLHALPREAFQRLPGRA